MKKIDKSEKIEFCYWYFLSMFVLLFEPRIFVFLDVFLMYYFYSAKL